MKIKNIKEALKDIDFDINEVALGDFDLIGEFTAKKNRDRNSSLYKTAGCFFRPNYERGILIYALSPSVSEIELEAAKDIDKIKKDVMYYYADWWWYFKAIDWNCK